MAVLSLASMGRELITCPFSNMPGGHSRSHFSERFGFQPKPWARTRGFQKDAAEKVKLSRHPLYKYWWGSCGELHRVERCSFRLENAMRKELSSFENPTFVSAEYLKTWCWVMKCCINILTGMKPLWKGISIQWRYICAYVVYFEGFPVIVTSWPSPGISRCALTISVLQQHRAIGAVADQ